MVARVATLPHMPQLGNRSKSWSWKVTKPMEPDPINNNAGVQRKEVATDSDQDLRGDGDQTVGPV